MGKIYSKISLNCKKRKINNIKNELANNLELF